MKKLLYTIALSFFATGVMAQSSADVTPSDVRVVKNGDNVDVSFNLSIGQKATKPNYRLIITPVLEDGSNTQSLKPVYVESYRLRLIEEREKMSKRSYVPLPDGFKTSNGNDVAYHASVPFEKWMSGSRLVFKVDQAGCCSSKSLPGILVADKIIAPSPAPIPAPQIEPKFTPVPSIGEVQRKWQFTRKELIINYKIGSSVVIEDFSNNKDNLNEILNAVKAITEDPSRHLSAIEITGHASPDGGLANNIRLSNNRAVALQKYLQKMTPTLADTVFKLKNGEVNWKGLRTMVEESSMEYREQVLETMDRVPEGNELKMALMDLKWGRPYNYMLKNFFPSLRNACYVTVFYDTLGDTAADSINQAIGMIGQKNYDQALTMLLANEKDARSWNAIGVCYMMKEDYTKAKSYFKRAIEAGNAEAKENLKQIENK